MKTLVINNQKGGVGKTMLAVHAAWFLAESGARVLVIDLDPQANASYTLSNARPGGSSADLFFKPDVQVEPHPGVTILAGDRELDAVDAQLTRTVPAFRTAFDRVAGGFDYVVIDTPPTWSGRNYAALMVATSLIAPIDLETYALQGVKQLLAQKGSVEKAARQGRPIDFLGLLPSRFQSQSPRQRDSLQALLRQQGARIMYPGQGVLTQRQGYAEALDLRTPVWMIRKTAAQEAGREIRRVLATMKQRLDNLPGPA
ncbi:ParA family protein [Phenylobacterium sp. LjRoot219]|uniref:ParA family protein n=1 Tax=Phenylobacterium sp. LjRoot219 TaxID=3342283 RepID=UPI003ED03FC5